MDAAQEPKLLRLHFFFRNSGAGGAYSVERLFDAIIAEIPRDRFTVRRFVCPFTSKGLVRRLLLMVWAVFRQGDINHITGDVNFIGIFMHRGRTVQTVHDAHSLQRLRGLSRIFYKVFWLTLPLHRAGRITAVSNQTRFEIAPFAGANGAGISTIPNCMTVKCEQTEPPQRNGPQRILQVGTMPNKNLEGVIAALQGLPCILVIIGSLTTEQRAALDDARIDFENYVALDDAALLDQYRRANLVVFASTYEGFGLPILEAQALGRAVVTSDREPMRSVAGAGAILVDPDDPAAIRRGIERVLGDANVERGLCAAGRSNVARYGPDKIAAQYCELYWELAGTVRGRPS